MPIAMVAEKYSINEPVLVFMGDDFIWNPNGKSASETLLETVQSDQESAMIGVEVPHDQVDKYGILSIKDGMLTDIVEKPAIDEAPSNLINVSKYIVSPELLQEIVKYVKTHDFGPKDQEYVITDPIDTYIQNGGVMRVASAEGQYLDGGSVEGWIHANNVVCNSVRE